MFFGEQEEGIYCTVYFLMKARELLNLDEEQAEAFALRAQQFGKLVKVSDYRRIPCLKQRDYAKGEIAYMYRGMYAVITDCGTAVALHKACREEKAPNTAHSGCSAKKNPVYNRKKLRSCMDYDNACFFEA